MSGKLIPNKPSMNPAKYIRAIPPVAAKTPILNFSVTLIIPDRYRKSIARRVRKVRLAA
jgi:hypothetical protein